MVRYLLSVVIDSYFDTHSRVNWASAQASKRSLSSSSSAQTAARSQRAPPVQALSLLQTPSLTIGNVAAVARCVQTVRAQPHGARRAHRWYDVHLSAAPKARKKILSFHRLLRVTRRYMRRYSHGHSALRELYKPAVLTYKRPMLLLSPDLVCKLCLAHH